MSATCQRIIIINRGEIVAEDTFEGLSKRMSDTRRFFVRIRRNQDFESQIKKISGVKSVRKVADGNSFEVEMEKSDDLSEKFSEAVVKSGAGLMEFRSVDASLEDIFLKLTTTDHARVAEVGT